MKLINMICPHCGAQLEIEEGRKQAYCGHCGSKLLIDDEVIHHKIDDAEEAGYKFEKGRQKAQAEARMREAQIQQMQMQQRQASSYVPPDLEKPKKRRTWLWVIGWLCMFPVPLTILMLRKKDMDPKLRYGIIAAGWLVYLALGMSGGKNSGTSGSNQTSTPAETKAALETVKTAEPNKNLEALLGTNEEGGSGESAAETKQKEPSGTSQDPRPQRNGFDRCNTVTAGLYEFQVPDYFVQSNDVDYYRGYAETGGKTAFLDIVSNSDETDQVGMEWFETDEKRREAIGSYLASLSAVDESIDTKLLSSEVYKAEECEGALYKFQIKFQDIPCSGMYFMFPSEENNHWVSVILNSTDNTEYRYDEDFMRIINSAKRLAPSAEETSAAQETVPETTTVEAITVQETTEAITEPETKATTAETQAQSLMTVKEYGKFAETLLPPNDYVNIETSGNVVNIAVAKRGIEDAAMLAISDKKMKKEWDKSMREIQKLSKTLTDQGRDFCGENVLVSVSVLSDKDHKTVLYSAIEGKKILDITDR